MQKDIVLARRPSSMGITNLHFGERSACFIQYRGSVEVEKHSAGSGSMMWNTFSHDWTPWRSEEYPWQWNKAIFSAKHLNLMYLYACLSIQLECLGCVTFRNPDTARKQHGKKAQMNLNRKSEPNISPWHMFRVLLNAWADNFWESAVRDYQRYRPEIRPKTDSRKNLLVQNAF
jgi:hypothetical protein